MTLDEAQRDMRRAYLGGATGLFASACAWLVAAAACRAASPQAGVLALIFGGMLIFPVSVVLAKALGRSGAHARDNPLGRLALETTGLLLMGIPVAWLASLQHVQWFFPAMLAVVGGRYLTFCTLYGLRAYWLCGGAMALAAFALVATHAPAISGAATGAAIELVFAAVVFVAARRGLDA